MFAHFELAQDFQSAQDFLAGGENVRTALSRLVDSTVLKSETVWTKVESLCEEAVVYGFRAVCVSPCFVASAKEYLHAKKKFG